MICSQCAAEMPEVSAFCPGCGRPVGALEMPRAAGTSDALLGGLAYATVVPAILFLAVPALKSSRFVRFHSWQSVFFGGAAVVAILVMRFLFAIFSVLPAIGFLVACLVIGVTSIAMVVIWLVLTLKAIQGKSYELPIVGAIAANLAG